MGRSGSAPVEVLLKELAGLTDQHRLDVVFATGQAVVARLYGGDAEAWRHRARGDSSYRRLEQHPALPIKASELYRALRIFEIIERQPLLLNGSLTVSHFLCVLSLPGTAQDRLLHNAKERGWTVRELRRELGDIDIHGAITGRPRVPAALKTLQGPLASLSAFDDVDSLIAVDRDTAKALLEVCHRTREAMLRVESILSNAHRAGECARVLVVDAVQGFTMRARRELQKHVRSVWIAHSCSQALVRVDANVSCAAINVELPDGSGVELSRRLRRQYPDLACVFTASEGVSLPEALRGDGAPIVPRTSGLRHLSIAVLKALPADDAAPT
jgi:CheY-like chemotaxis protein